MDKGQENKKVAKPTSQKHPGFNLLDAIVCKGCHELHFFRFMRTDDIRFPRGNFSVVEVFCRNVSDGSYGSYGKWFAYENPKEIMTPAHDKAPLELRVKTLEKLVQDLSQEIRNYSKQADEQKSLGTQFNELKAKVELLTSSYAQELDKSKTDLKEFLAKELERLEELAKKKWSTPVS